MAKNRQDDGKNICVPLNKRTKNMVDELTLEIKNIQESCEHNFRLIKKPKIKESLISDVFVGSTMGPTDIEKSELSIVLVCMKCSKKQEASICCVCPRCLGSMRETGCQGAGSREVYFGCSYVYYSINLIRCRDCGFTIASDEWDQ